MLHSKSILKNFKPLFTRLLVKRFNVSDAHDDSNKNTAITTTTTVTPPEVPLSPISTSESPLSTTHSDHPPTLPPLSTTHSDHPPTLPPLSTTHSDHPSTLPISAVFPEPEVKPKPKSLEFIDDTPDLFLRLEQLESAPETEAMRKSLPFDEVPGPMALKRLSKFWSSVPILGTQVTASAIQYFLSAGSQLSWGTNLWMFKWLLDEYGPVVRLHGPLGGDVVILSRPEHASAVFHSEGRYPIRSSLDCVEKYRLQFRRYKQAGPFIMYGPEWEKLRKNLERPLHDSMVQQYDELVQSSDDFIVRITRIRNRQDEVPVTFRNEIYKWAMECMCSITLGKRLGFLDPIGLSMTSEPARLLEGLIGATEAIRRCESGLHMWKFVETPAWKELVRNCDVIDTIMNKYIHRTQDVMRQRKISDDSNQTAESVSLIESLMIKDVMSSEDVLTILLDMVLIGVNSVAHSVAFLLYHLARYPRAQRRVYEEILNAPSQVTSAYLKTMRYLQACIKESLRLKPPMPILSRVLSKDVLVYNYRIPRGTYILIATHLSSLREEHFEDAYRFKPERWLDSEIYMDNGNFASLPFGYGPKACLARELAETQISLLLTKILRKYRIEYHYGDINSTHRLLAAPDRPLRLRFVDRR